MDNSSILTEQQKKDMLVKRGFSLQEIESGLDDYVNGSKVWEITVIDAQTVASSYDSVELKKLFQTDSVGNLSICPRGEPDNNFKKYASKPLQVDSKIVNAATLEPYVARLVLAINPCGIFTWESCDGWHTSRPDDWLAGRLWITFADIFSSAWYEAIIKDVLGETKSFFLPGMAYTQDMAKKTPILRFNGYAVFFEKHREDLLEYRDKWMNELKGREKCTRDEVYDIIKKCAVPDLKSLKNKWRN